MELDPDQVAGERVRQSSLVVLSEVDPAGSLPSSLRDRLAAPFMEAVGI